jgi:uncharacterized phage protein gp47/JayE
MTTNSLQEIIDQLVIDIQALEPDFTALNNLTTYSRIRNFVLADSRQIYNTQQYIEETYNDIYISSASSNALDLHLADRGLTRGEATKATGTIRIGRSTVPSQTYTLPQLTVVSTGDDTPIQFQTLSEVSINPSTPIDGEGYYTVEVDVEALNAGDDGNVVSMAINTIVTTITGYNIVYNVTATSGGTDEESDANVRTRLLESQQVFDRGTRAWFIQQAQEFSFVKDASLGIAEEGNGQVTVYLAGYGALTPTQITEVQDYFDDEAVNDAGAYIVTVEEITDTTINIEIDVYRLDLTMAASEIEDLIDDYFDDYMYIGKDFVLTQLQSYILQNISSSRIYDVEFVTPTSNQVIPDSQIGVIGTKTVNMIDQSEG